MPAPRRASYTRKPELAQLPTHNRVSRSVNICVTSRERSVNTGCKRLFGRYSICVIITLITHLDEAHHDTPDTATNVGTFSGRSHG